MLSPLDRDAERRAQISMFGAVCTDPLIELILLAEIDIGQVDAANAGDGAQLRVYALMRHQPLAGKIIGIAPGGKIVGRN